MPKKSDKSEKPDKKPKKSNKSSTPVIEVKEDVDVSGSQGNGKGWGLHSKLVYDTPSNISTSVPVAHEIASPVIDIKQIDYDNLNEKQLDLLNEFVFVCMCSVPREEITKSDWAEAPDFSRSLDACRHFEKVLLSEDIKAKYIMAILTQYPVDQIKCRAWQMLRFANPVELCVAYLKAVGVWERDGVEKKLESLS